MDVIWNSMQYDVDTVHVMHHGLRNTLQPLLTLSRHVGTIQPQWGFPKHHPTSMESSLCYRLCKPRYFVMRAHCIAARYGAR